MEVYSINLHENLHENLTGKYGPEKTLKKKKKKLYTFFAIDLQCLIISILNVIFFYEVMEIILGRISWRTVLLINKNDF